MKIEKGTLVVLLLFIICWLQLYIGALMYFVLIIALIMLCTNHYLKNVIRIDTILMLLLGVVFFSYILNLQNYDLISKNHAEKTGNYIPHLYFKIVFNSFFFFIGALFCYALGFYWGRNEKLQVLFYSFIQKLFLLNSIIAVLAWFIKTGGVIDRYNFISPIDNSPSASATFALWGLLVTLSFGTKSIINKLSICIFILNLLIVVTRATQVISVISIFYYYYLVKKDHFKLSNRNLFIIIICLCLMPFLFLYAFKTFGGFYENMLNADSYDVLSRKSSIDAAIDIFLHNPFWGVGLGMFGPYNMNMFRGVILESAHNGAFSVLSELGILGFVIVIFLCFNILKYTSVNNIICVNPLINRVRIANIVNLRIIVVSFFIANFTLLPPINERIYYLSSFFAWAMLGIVHYQYCNSKSLQNK